MTSPPLPVTFLHPYVKDWRRTEQGIVIYPKSNEFDKLTLRPHFTFPTGEPLGWEFIATVNIVPDEEMDEKAAELYENLKAAECLLKRHGLFRRKLQLEPLCGTRADPKLAMMLNENRTLTEALETVNISELRVTFSSGQRRISEENANNSDVSYSKPTEITCFVMALKSYTLPIERLNRTKCKSDFINTFKALSEISEIVKNLCNDKLTKLRL